MVVAPLPDAAYRRCPGVICPGAVDARSAMRAEPGRGSPLRHISGPATIRALGPMGAARAGQLL